MLVIVAAAIIFSFGARFYLGSNSISYRPNALAYLAEYATPAVQMLDGKALPVKCSGTGQLECKNAAAASYYAMNNATGIARYEQFLRIKLRNGGEGVNDIRISFESENAECVYLGNAFSLSTGEAKDRLDFLCVNVIDKNKFYGRSRIVYEAANGLHYEEIIEVR